MKKRYGILPQTVPGKEEGPPKKKALKKVLVIEDDQQAFDKIVMVFANRGYELLASKNGVEGMERAMISAPDVILIKLGLPDLPGDVVALKLKRMPKTMEIPVLLYRPYDIRSEYTVEKIICEKAGIDRVIESDDPQVLLKEVEKKWQEAQRASAGDDTMVPLFF